MYNINCHFRDQERAELMSTNLLDEFGPLEWANVAEQLGDVFLRH